MTLLADVIFHPHGVLHEDINCSGSTPEPGAWMRIFTEKGEAKRLK